MGFWDGIEAVEIPGTPKYMGVGLYDVEVTRCIHKSLREGGDAFIVEFKILTSTNPDHAPGSSGSWYQGFEAKGYPSADYRKLALGKVKGFVAALFGIETGDATSLAKLSDNLKLLMEAATGEQNKLAGKCVHLETYTTEKKDGGLFTIYKFTPYKEVA